MSAKRSTPKAASPPASLQEIADAARAAANATPGLTGADLKRALPAAMKPHTEQALSALRDLAIEGALFRFVKGKKERFFPADPVGELDRAVPELLRRTGPLTDADLKKALRDALPGYLDLLPGWLKSAVGRSVVFEHAPVPTLGVWGAGRRRRSGAPTSTQGKRAAGKKRFGHAPDLAKLLAKTLSELKKALGEIDRAGVPHADVLRIFHDVLAPMTPTTPTTPTTPMTPMTADEPRAGRPAPDLARSDKEVVASALRDLASQRPSGSLLLVREVRARVPLDKPRFDAAALALLADGTAILHHHDHAPALPEADRAVLVTDGAGTYYVGIAPGSLG